MSENRMPTVLRLTVKPSREKIAYLLGFLDSLLVAFYADGRGALVVVGNVDDDIRLLFQLVH